MKHLIIALVLVVVVTALVILGLQSLDLVPQLASSEGQFVDQMFSVQIYIISFIFSLIVVLMLYSVVVFRRREGDTTDGPYIKGNTPLEIAWTVIPLVVVIALATWGAGQLTEITASEPDELVVEVTGFQFGWRFDYPEYGVSSSELFLPLNRQILFKITSTDVIHDFWVSEFRIKQDAVPGRWTELRVTPTKVGDYRVRCAELCGYSHTTMYAPVVVVDEENFQAWISGKEVEMPPPQDMSPADLGARLVEEQGCLSCHSVDGSAMVGPSWLGLFGSQQSMEDGTTVVADEAYLRESIMDPQAHVVAGYPNIMPAAYTFLSDEEVDAMIEYIKSLGE